MKIADNTIVAIRRYFSVQLAGLYEEREIKRFFELSAEQFLGVTAHDYIMHQERRVSESEILRFITVVKGLKGEKPIQYLLGTAHFCGLELNVNDAVLIPRPETEELVEWVVQTLRYEKKAPTVLDIGTGSGCIALALKKAFPGGTMLGIDISEKALEVAKSNAKLLNFAVDFRQADVLSDDIGSYGKFDAIVSNPPYVMHSEMNEMRRNVVDYEPHTALFVPDNDPLVFHNRIASLALNMLNKGGWLFFEINERWGEKLCDLLTEKGFKNVELKKDLSMKNRLIKCNV